LGYKNREVEVKMVVNGVTRMADVDRALQGILKGHRRKIAGDSEDTYFHKPVLLKVPRVPKADFIRLRRPNKDDISKFTVKYADRGGNFDRVEKDSDVTQFKQMRSQLVDILGEPAGVLRKRYVVYFMGSRGHEADTTVSLYQVKGDKRVFLEIEAKTADKVDYWTKRVLRALPHGTIRVYESLYELFISGRE
jgi:adenylate cyclase class IV